MMFLTDSSITTERVLNSVDILDLWRALGLGPTLGNRGQASWRGGQGFNVALNREQGVYFDFVANEGGGKVKLVKTVLGFTNAEAFSWLAKLAGINLDCQVSLPQEDKRQLAEIRCQARELSRRVMWWFEARLAELEIEKTRLNGDAGQFCEEKLHKASSTLFRLRQTLPKELLLEWREAWRLAPEETARLESESQQVDVQCRAALQLLVDLIATKESTYER